MIINFHPKEIASNACNKLVEKLKEGHDVFVPSDKTPDGWKQVVNGTERIILVAPVYWWGMSYEFDKWIQDLLTYNYAFTFDNGKQEGLLKGREFEIHMTHGTPTEYAEVMHKNIIERLNTGVFGYCDAKIDVKFYWEKSL